jgi:hypothetical protein
MTVMTVVAPIDVTTDDAPNEVNALIAAPGTLGIAAPNTPPSHPAIR